MISTILLILLAGAGLYALKIYRQFAINVAAAKASGIKYTIVPVFLVNRIFQIACIIIVPILKRLPSSWTDIWFDLILGDWPWKRGYEPFKRFDAETFLTVAPDRIVLNTAEASVIDQITTRRNDFPKALEVYESLKIYGNNIVTSEGQLWRHHRKITSPPFSEKNNHLVWAESLAQTEAMVKAWKLGIDGRSNTIHTVADDAMRLSLHIISRAGFGVRLSWPSSEDKTVNSETSEQKAPEEGIDWSEGHTMSYTDSLGSLLHNIICLFFFPPKMLKTLPFEATKTAYKSFVEWGRYMNEMLEHKKQQILAGTEGEDLDLMVAMLKGAGITSQSSSSLEKGEETPKQTLTDEQILGNAFIFILAGHETTANSIHFALVYLAMNMSSQRHLQADLDKIFLGRPVNEWDYDRDVPRLYSSMAGAVLNEQLRLLPPVLAIPKVVGKDGPQPLIVGGKKCMVPANTYISLITSSAHRNPNQWPAGPPTDPLNPAHLLSNLDNDLEEFKPERWLLDNNSKSAQSLSERDQNDEAAHLDASAGSEPPAGLYRPPKGAFIPFSDGYRSCLGRRFAQVELFAVLAVIFSQYSIELSVSQFATEEEVEKMGEEERKEVWGFAHEYVQAQMRHDMASVITLQLREGSIGLRLVKRGSEKFNWK